MAVVEQELDQELSRFCAEAKKRRARAVVLFGSRAKGEYTDESDADVCLIADDLPEDLFRRRYPAVPGYRFLSVLGFHSREFLELLHGANPLALDIVHEGKPLYDDGFLKEARKVFEEAIRRYELRRTDRGWNWKVAKRPQGRWGK